MSGVGSGVGWVLSPPPSKDNGGAAHCSPHGLIAYGAGSSVVVMEPRTMQLVAVLPMIAPKNASLQPAPFVTAVQWTPEGISRDLVGEDFSTAHMQLAVGDRHGRVAIWDVASGDICTWLDVDAEKGKQGIQDVCWVYGQPWLLAVIHGPTSLNIWDPVTGRCIWRFDSGGELLGCVRADPFDPRQFCLVGLRGLLMSVLVAGVSDSEILTKQYIIPGQDEKGLMVEKTRDGTSSSGSSSSGTPALAFAPGVIVRCLYSRTRRGLLYVMMPREIVVFDLAFGMPLATTSLPRGCSKLLDLLACADGDVLYCAHQDGKVSAWRRKEDKQVFSLCFMGTLMPSIGSPVPAPAVLAVVHCPLQLQVQKSSNDNQSSSLQVDSLPGAISVSSTLAQNDQLVEVKILPALEATLLSITDDGRLLRWVINGDDAESEPISLTGTKLTHRNSGESNTTGELVHSNSNGLNSEALFKLDLTGQLQLLSSVVTTLAVPMPSILAMGLGGEGSNAGAVSVPLVALACQGGSLELVDTAANTITASFAVHSNQTVRGVRWLGNTRLVSFSYTEVKGKGGGFVNRLVLTCVRSGHSKVFRVIQKPERSPMRALRTSPSGRYLLILFKEAPAEVWEVSSTPQMIRSVALPFTVMEWALPPAPKAAAAAAASWGKKTAMMKERPTIASAAASASAPIISGADSQDSEIAESFAFALVNGSLGVFELRGRRVRDFKPKFPSASFVSADVLITAMAYRTPHVVMGDRTGSIRWWDVVTGLSSSFSTHRGGVRRIKFAPVRIGDPTRGRIAVLFNDHSFAVYDLDTHDPLTHSLVQPHLGGILVLELDWYPLRPDKNEPLLLCIAGADGSFRLLEVQNLAGSKSSQLAKPTQWQRYRPMPLCCAALLPPPHALSLRIILQQGVQPSWLAIETTSTGEASIQRTPSQALGSRGGDLRHYLIPHNPVLGETVFAEVLLKALEPYRRAGRLLDEERVEQYAAVFKQGVATRCAFAAAQFGENSEAVFWLQLPRALALLSYGSAGPTAFWRPMRQSNSSATGENSQESEVKESYDSEVPVNESLDSGMTFINPKVAIPFTPVGVLPAAPFKLIHV
ncbi:uncharacterized protein [Physcomitrium patens]|uniref:uncharacterized protein isoform X3 n=1 Tax=Physcomitrium patens TaxID=3218 RepID=UPI000D16E6B5|nr:uncharacterized protein LOC112288484 isoform X2 [Physcomitrium patens]|eukprot:XP_024388450.1 uncharacterized protein LOC112288484 isoform X2 [Physcomitrella patens]